MGRPDLADMPDEELDRILRGEGARPVPRTPQSPDRLLEELRLAPDNDARAATIRALLGNEAQIRALAEVAPGPLAAWLEAVGELTTRRQAGVLERVIRAEQRVVPIRGRGSDPAPSPVELPDEAPDWPVPPGYVVDGSGVQRVLDEGMQRVALAPIGVVDRYADADSGAAMVDLAWWDGSRWIQDVVPRRTVADSRAIVGLADRGAPVTSPLAPALVQYLSEQEALLQSGPRAATMRCGWHGPAYQLGRATLGGELRIVPEPEVEPLVDGLVAGGTWEGWLAMVERVRHVPAAWLAIYAAMTGPMLHPLGLDVGMVVSYAAPRASGKTSVVRLAASAWGRPSEVRGVIRSWDATPYGIEQCAAAMCDAVLILDETSRVQDRYRSQVSPTVYALANGAGRQRGRERRRSWRVCAISTGEVPLRSYGGLEGASSRTIEVVGSPMPDAATAQAVEAESAEHYGHLAPRVIQRLLTLDHAQMRDYYRRSVERLQAERPHLPRACRMMAALSTAASVVHLVGVPQPTCDAWGWLWSQVERHASESSQPAQAREVLEAAMIVEWRAGRWPQDEPPPYAMAVQILTRAGLPGSAIIEQWKDLGWIQVDADGRLPRSSACGGRVRVVRLLSDAG